MHRYFVSFFACNVTGQTAFMNCEVELDRPLTQFDGTTSDSVRGLEMLIRHKFQLRSVTVLHFQKFEAPQLLVGVPG